MDPLFTAEFHREHARIIFDKTKEKIVPVQEVVNILNQHLGVFKQEEEAVKDTTVFQASKSFLGSLSFDKGKDVRVFLYKEAMRADIMFDLRKIQVEEYFRSVLGVGPKSKEGQEMLAKAGVTIDGNFVVFPNCLMPNFIASIKLTLANDKKTFAVGAVKYGMTDVPRELAKIDKNTLDIHKVVKTIGSRPPFPNFYEDGGMCYGSNTPLVTINNDNNYRPLESYANLITQSAFNFDLLPRVIPPRFRGIEFYKTVTGKTLEGAPAAVSRDGSYNRFVNFMFFLTTATEFPYEDFKRESY